MCSPHLFTQFNGIGITLSSHLVNEGITTFAKVLELGEARIEAILNKNSAFGTSFVESIKRLPQFEIIFSRTLAKHTLKHNTKLSQSDDNDEIAYIDIQCKMLNFAELRADGNTLGECSQLIIVVGDSCNTLIHFQRMGLDILLFFVFIINFG